MPGRAYADVIGNFNRGHAGRLARDGRYARAAEVVVADDPEMAASYAAMEDRRRAREARDETRAYSRDMARALHRGDYAAAGERAAAFGDVEGASNARAMLQQMGEQQRVENWRRARGYMRELEQIEGMRDPTAQQAAWATFLGRAREEARENEGVAFLSQFPEQYSPNAAGAFRTQLQRMSEQLLTPQQIMEMERRGQQYRPATGEELRGFRPGTAVDIDTNTGARVVRQNPTTPPRAEQGPPTPPSGFVLD